MLKTILIDDELHCVETLRYELQLNCPEVEIVDTASSGQEGIQKIQEIKPDLVFLDIEMPRMSGFEMLRQLEPLDFRVIFVTAYDQYALQAFRFAAADYLLKPVMSDQLKDAVGRVAEKSVSTVDAKIQLEALLFNLRDGFKSPRIALPSGRGMDFVDAAQIMYCTAESNYTHVILADGKKYTLSKTLKDVEQMLENLDFFRIHQSHLINFTYLQRYMRDDGGYVVMRDGTSIPIAKRRKEEFLAKMKLG
ncbi:MAG TPA: LytTR family DNA-binding domain-containing protein [Saprospiraceae bacterium]|jgi:two-component system LytT family response regulator|nr:LytTR family DNA-binding domain-containing protein [Saprospiraceae bacterium]